MRWVVGLLMLVASGCGGSSENELVVFGAASLTDVLQEFERRFEEANPDIDVVLNLAGSNTLAQQLRAGADADLFLPADTGFIEQAIADGDAFGPITTLGQNQLVIAVPAGNPADISGLDDFERGDLLLGLCESAVPCGRLADQSLAAAGVTPSLDTREPDVRALLTKIAAEALDAGVVYTSDVQSDTAVEGVAIDEQFQQVNTYAIARTSDHQANDALIALLTSAEGRAVFTDFGVRVGSS